MKETKARSGVNICVLASGSTGNVTAIWTATTGILIDCGRSRKYIETNLDDIGFDRTLLKGIVVTHGHGDHVGTALIGMAKAYGASIHIHPETHYYVRMRPGCDRIDHLNPGMVCHHDEDSFTIGDLVIQPFLASHRGGSVGRPYGFSITYTAGEQRCKIGYLTDTGTTNEAMIAAMADANVLVLEANHDPELVHASRRHPANKRWVLSKDGHLSNLDHAETIVNIRKVSSMKRAPSHVYMAHVSKEHNTLELAERQIRERLSVDGMDDVKLLPTWHGKHSMVLRLVPGCGSGQERI